MLVFREGNFHGNELSLPRGHLLSDPGCDTGAQLRSATCQRTVIRVKPSVALSRIRNSSNKQQHVFTS